MTGERMDLDTEFFEPTVITLPEPQRIAASSHGMVSTAHLRATEAGVSILEEGGNAIDAAVAAAFALGICEPHASGLGGQTIMLIYSPKAGKPIVLDGSSRAPNRAVIEAFISQVRSAMEVGRLPAKDWQDARKYFDETKNAV